MSLNFNPEFKDLIINEQKIQTIRKGDKRNYYQVNNIIDLTIYHICFCEAEIIEVYLIERNEFPTFDDQFISDEGFTDANEFLVKVNEIYPDIDPLSDQIFTVIKWRIIK